VEPSPSDVGGEGETRFCVRRETDAAVVGIFPSGVGGQLVLQEWEEALLPGNKADMFFPECLGVDVSVSYEFRGLKVV
jgi:hypothetical protein